MDPNLQNEDRPKVWLWIALGVVVVASAVFFYVQFRPTTGTQVTASPTAAEIKTNTLQTSSTDLKQTTQDLSSLDDDLSQIDKIDANLGEDDMPSL